MLEVSSRIPGGLAPFFPWPHQKHKACSECQYLKGLYFTYRPSPEALNKALDYFRKSIDADPNFALAYAGMATIYANMGTMSLAPPADMLPKAKTAFQKALALDNLLAEAHFHTGYLAFYFEWDWETAERSYEQALAINPGNALVHATYAWVCLAQSRFEEAVKQIKLAQSLDPLMPLFYAFSVGIHWSVGKPDDAISEFEKAVEMDPHSGLTYFHVGVAYVLKREVENAIAALQKSKELAVYSGWADGWLGLIHISEGDREKAERILDEMLAQKKRAYVLSMIIGWLWRALGNFDRAFEYFDKAREERDTLMPFVRIYTKIFVPEIQKDPRFKALLKTMKLDEE